jgi:hypothetical protein
LTKAIIDTTILTDALLNSGPARERALASLRRYDVTQLPVYAIKEFKRGPFQNFVWMYNKLASRGSFSQAMVALHAMSRTPKRYTTSTALEAIVKAASSIANRTLGSSVAKYGAEASLDKVYCDELRLALKKTIYQAWAKRRGVTTDIVFPLSCYDERAPYESRGLIEIAPTKCDREPTCCLTKELRAKSADLEKMKLAIDGSGSQRNEDRRRAKALRHVYRTKQDVSDDICRNLGDAVFVALAPRDAVILTTNLGDFDLLARAINKKAQAPDESLVAS